MIAKLTTILSLLEHNALLSYLSVMNISVSCMSKNDRGKSEMENSVCIPLPRGTRTYTCRCADGQQEHSQAEGAPKVCLPPCNAALCHYRGTCSLRNADTPRYSTAAQHTGLYQCKLVLLFLFFSLFLLINHINNRIRHICIRYM